MIVSGCSYTDHNHVWWDSDKNEHCDVKWPEHLRNMLNEDIELINLGKSGAGNEYIYTSLRDKILDIDPGNIELVMAAWSGSRREDWITKRINRYGNPRLDWIFNNHGNDANRPPDYNRDHGFMHMRTLNWRWSMQMLSSQLGFKYLEVNMLNDLGEDNLRKSDNNLTPQPLVKLMDPMVSLTECYAPTKDFNVRASVNQMILDDHEDRVSKDDYHPNAQGHIKIAEWMYNEIQRLGY